jgi:hypothetical protein
LEKVKRRNRAYLKRVFTVKSLFYPVMYAISATGAGFILESFLNKIVKVFGIKKSVRYFFKYRQYGKLFRNEFRETKSGGSGKILFPMMAGVNSNFTLLNLLFAKYFKQKDNFEPLFYICDSAFEICTKDGMLKSRKQYPWFCHECWHGFLHIERKSGIRTMKMSEYLPDNSAIDEEKNKINNLSTLEGCYSYTFDGIPVGLYARKSVLRYFLTGSLEEEEKVLDVFRRFLIAGVSYKTRLDAFLEKESGIKYAIMNNGSLIFEAVAREVFRRTGIDYITYETYIGNNSLVYKKNGAVMDFDWDIEYEKIKGKLEINDKVREQVHSFFENLKSGIEMYAVLNREHNASKLSNAGKYACLFTNLNFDTAVIDKNSAFKSMEAWIFGVIDFWRRNNPEISLVIRVHPGEIKLVTATTEFLGERIKSAVGDAKNIVVFDTWEKINSYELISGMEFGLIYSSTIGLEIAWAGKKCLVGGLPWFRNKPFVLYSPDFGGYFSILSSLLNNSSKFVPDRDELIKTVIYIFFIRLKRFRGLRLYTPREDPNTDHEDIDRMLKENINFFDEFREELLETTL